MKYCGQYVPCLWSLFRGTYILNLDGTAVKWWTMAKWETTRFLVTTIGLSIFHPFLCWQWERRCTCNRAFILQGWALEVQEKLEKESFCSLWKTSEDVFITDTYQTTTLRSCRRTWTRFWCTLSTGWVHTSIRFMEQINTFNLLFSFHWGQLRLWKHPQFT